MFLRSLKTKQEYEEEKIKDLINQRDSLELEIKKLNSERESVQKSIENELESFRMAQAGFNVLEEIGYEQYIPTTPDNEVEKKIYQKETELAKLSGSDNIILYDRTYRIDGSEAKGKKFQTNYGKNLLIGFNSYLQSKTKLVSNTNCYKIRELIEKSFNKYNNQGQVLGIQLNKEYLDLQLDILQLELEMKIKKNKEKNRLREERRKIREQEKLLEEIAKEQDRLEQERKSMDIAFAKALTETERQKIKAQINKIDRRLDDLEYRKEHNNSGWLYVISSPSLPNMVKIGCTRRLNPTIRVKELSSSSLPYAFHTHGFVFSDNCFELETQMHHYFDDKRVAPDREFFYISPQEAISVLKNKFNQEVHFETMEEDKDV